MKSEIVQFNGGGDTEKVVNVTILDDLLSEKTEYFTISIEPIDSDLTFPINEAVIGIEDNDGMHLSVIYYKNVILFFLIRCS